MPHSMFDLCDGTDAHGDPCPVCCDHVRGQLKFNGGNPVYLCAACGIIICYEDGTPYS